jgi:hypothetical protein
MSGNHSDDSATSTPRRVPLEPAGERSLEIEDRPPRQEEPRQIHQRRPLPVVPDRKPDESE